MEKKIENLIENKDYRSISEIIGNQTINFNIIDLLSYDDFIQIIDTDKVEEIISFKNYGDLKKILSQINEVDLANILENLSDENLLLVFRLLPKELASNTFVEFDPETQTKLINKLTDTELTNVLDELFIDDMADIIEEMPANVVKRILKQSDKDTRQILNEILKYPKDSAGSIMTVEFVNLKPSMTVSQAFEKIKKTAIDKETVYTCYVTDNTRSLLGYVSVRQLLIADTNTTIENIMNENVISAHTTDDKEEVARKFANYGFMALPVIDKEDKLVGIITVDDAIDVIDEETDEDISKMAAVTPSDKPYLKTSIWEIWKNRVPWLLLLMISSTFTALIINNYESQLTAISSVLFACVPMIMGTGGNAGSQVSVTIIRSLAVNELTTKDLFKAIWKELRASILLGITLGLACFVKLIVLDNMIFQITDYTAIRCLVISIALVVTIIVAKLVGCILPLIAKKCHLDPAVVANPFITTIIDVVSLIVYCSLAVTILA